MSKSLHSRLRPVFSSIQFKVVSILPKSTQIHRISRNRHLKIAKSLLHVILRPYFCFLSLCTFNCQGKKKKAQKYLLRSIFTNHTLYKKEHHSFKHIMWMIHVFWQRLIHKPWTTQKYLLLQIYLSHLSNYVSSGHHFLKIIIILPLLFLIAAQIGH